MLVVSCSWLRQCICGVMMGFVAIDVETANACQSSICQFGFAKVSGGQVIDAGELLIDPAVPFLPINISIHGIGPDQVVGSPSFVVSLPHIQSKIGSDVVVSHGPFDRIAITKALAKVGLPPLENPWLDSIRIIRRVWPEKFRKEGYGLAHACAELGVPLHRHHSAQADAVACARLVIHASARAGMDIVGLADLAAKSLRQIEGGGSVDISPDGPLVGEWVVFTGKMGLPRSELEILAKMAGGQVLDHLTRKATLLVAGQDEWEKNGPADMSAKHRKAMDLVESGCSSIRIITEGDFATLLGRKMSRWGEWT